MKNVIVIQHVTGLLSSASITCITLPSFSLAVPIFGFLGSLLFLIDVFQRRTPPEENEKEDINTSMEFVLRLVLGPYVAIVMVLLFRDTIPFMRVPDEPGAQATSRFSADSWWFCSSRVCLRG
jgi:hypothetical protein